MYRPSDHSSRVAVGKIVGRFPEDVLGMEKLEPEDDELEPGMDKLGEGSV